MRVPNSRALFASLIVLAAGLAVTSACSGKNDTPTSEPLPTATPITADTFGGTPVPAPPLISTVQPVETATSSPLISREQAVAIAEEVMSQDWDRVTAVQGMHSTVSRLMRVRDLPDSVAISPLGTDSDTLIWAVQVEGTSRTPREVVFQAGPSAVARTYRFNAAVVDAVTGKVIDRLFGVYQPIILPQQFVRQSDSLPIDYDAVELVALEVNPDEAIEIVVNYLKENGWEPFFDDYFDMDWVSYELVRLAPRYPPDPFFAFPTSSPAYATATPYPADAVYPLVWDIVLMKKFELDECGGVSFPPTSEPRHYRCWPGFYLYRVDAETGQVEQLSQFTAGAPDLDEEEYEIVEDYAETFGWWAVWHAMNDIGSSNPLQNFNIEDFIAIFDAPVIVVN